MSDVRNQSNRSAAFAVRRLALYSDRLMVVPAALHREKILIAKMTMFVATRRCCCRAAYRGLGTLVSVALSAMRACCASGWVRPVPSLVTAGMEEGTRGHGHAPASRVMDHICFEWRVYSS